MNDSQLNGAQINEGAPRNLVLLLASPTWDIYELVQLSSNQAWDVRAFSYQSLTGTWDVRAYVQNAVSANYDVTEWVLTSNSPSWLISSFVSPLSLSLSWGNYAFAYKALRLCWQVPITNDSTGLSLTNISTASTLTTGCCDCCEGV